VTRFEIVPERSQVWIDAKSSVHPIHSQTDGLEGFVELAVDTDGAVDVAAAARARLSLPVERLRSGNFLEERELKRRIDARRFPTIDGELTALSRDGDGTYLVEGTITFRGESRVYEAPMTIETVDDHTLQLAGEATFDVRDFGMEPPRILMLRVEPEVTVRVEIIAVATRRS
jgi:polyisoprenoid-binding protein YceI